MRCTAEELFELQWGHGDEAVEEPWTQLINFDKIRLQWGHGDEAVEELIENAFHSFRPVASMGPRR